MFCSSFLFLGLVTVGLQVGHDLFQKIHLPDPDYSPKAVLVLGELTKMLFVFNFSAECKDWGSIKSTIRKLGSSGRVDKNSDKKSDGECDNGKGPLKGSKDGKKTGTISSVIQVFRYSVPSLLYTICAVLHAWHNKLLPLHIRAFAMNTSNIVLSLFFGWIAGTKKVGRSDLIGASCVTVSVALLFGPGLTEGGGSSVINILGLVLLVCHSCSSSLAAAVIEKHLVRDDVARSSSRGGGAGHFWLYLWTAIFAFMLLGLDSIGYGVEDMVSSYFQSEDTILETGTDSTVTAPLISRKPVTEVILRCFAKPLSWLLVLLTVLNGMAIERILRQFGASAKSCMQVGRFFLAAAISKSLWKEVFEANFIIATLLYTMGMFVIAKRFGGE